jgi:hypothetical protein
MPASDAIGATHMFAWHCCVPEQVLQSEPPVPQASFAVPATHWPAAVQQPSGQDVESQPLVDGELPQAEKTSAYCAVATATRRRSIRGTFLEFWPGSEAM